MRQYPAILTEPLVNNPKTMFPAGAEPRPLESSRVERTNQEATLVPQGRTENHDLWEGQGLPVTLCMLRAKSDNLIG